MLFKMLSKNLKTKNILPQKKQEGCSFTTFYITKAFLYISSKTCKK